ncbi:actin, actin related protein, partial [Thalassiosira pseudonana CCMP1335]
QEHAIRRLDIGGKVLTNLLKEAVTYRQWNMMDEYHIVNDAKEQLCFVSDQFDKEMKQARIVRRGMRWFDREYLLPDFMNTFRGTQKRREQESLERQALAMSVERFAIPEVLFRPSDIGLDCDGIAEGIVESISACDATLRAAMYNNVLLVGGNARMPGYKERVEVELRKLAPVNYSVCVYLPEDSISYAWEGSKEFAKQPDFQ